MPIRTKPFDEIGESDITSLVARGIPEGRTLEYKLQLHLQDRTQRVEMLKDVSALANTVGGTIIYGVAEGEGEDAGLPVGVPGLKIAPGPTHEGVDQILQDGLDERLSGVLHGAVLTPTNGRSCYVIRVPPSPLAPHMIAVKTSGPRFYERGTASCQPMNARRIKEVALRVANAEDRALQVVEARTRAIRQGGQVLRAGEQQGRALLHVLPLLAPRDFVDFADVSVTTRLFNVGAPGGVSGVSRHALEGFYNEYPTARNAERHLLVVRNGGLEFKLWPIISEGKGGSSDRVLHSYSFENDILWCLQKARELTEASILTLPALLSLRLLDVGYSRLYIRKEVSAPQTDQVYDSDMFLPPFVLMAWGTESDRIIRRMFDILWQAYGLGRSLYYDDQGERTKLRN